jgi:hypothetical protein
MLSPHRHGCCHLGCIKANTGNPFTIHLNAQFRSTLVGTAKYICNSVCFTQAIEGKRRKVLSYFRGIPINLHNQPGFAIGTQRIFTQFFNVCTRYALHRFKERRRNFELTPVPLLNWHQLDTNNTLVSARIVCPFDSCFIAVI